MYSCAGSGAFYIPDIQTLDLVTDLNTAHTFDAFRRIADQWEIFVPRSLFQFLLKRHFKNVQVICDFLESTVSALYAGCTAAVMLREDQLYCFSPVHANFRTVSVDDHALFYFIIAGDDQFIFALQFDHAYTAGADLVDIF